MTSGINGNSLQYGLWTATDNRTNARQTAGENARIESTTLPFESFSLNQGQLNSSPKPFFLDQSASTASPESVQMETVWIEKKGEIQGPEIRPEFVKTLDFLSGAEKVSVVSFTRCGLDDDSQPTGLKVTNGDETKYFILRGGSSWGAEKGSIELAMSEAEMYKSATEFGDGAPENQLNAKEMEAMANALAARAPQSSGTERAQRIADTHRETIREQVKRPRRDTDTILQHELSHPVANHFPTTGGFQESGAFHEAFADVGGFLLADRNA